MYNLREFRAKTKEAFDKASSREVLISRNADVYTLQLKESGSYKPKPKVKPSPVTALAERFNVEVCEHGAGRGFCRNSKCKYSQFNKRNRL